MAATSSRAVSLVEAGSVLTDWLALERAFRRVTAAVTRDMSQTPLRSFAEFRILELLSESEGHALRHSEIADLLLLAKSRVNRLVTRLETAAFVQRVQSETDLRVTYVEITPAGWSVLDAAAPAIARSVQRHFNSRLLASPGELAAALAPLLRSRPSEIDDRP